MNTLRWDLSKSVSKIHALASCLEKESIRRITILCHNNPDPDSIAGAYGLAFLLGKKFGIRSFLCYGGVVTRAENKAMIHRLRIKMTRITKLNEAPTSDIALIDAQPGTGNSLVLSKDVLPLIVIDHHPLRKLSQKTPFHDVRPHYGSTSTIITEYLMAMGLAPTRSVANALMYGLKADTGSLVRGACKADFSAFSFLAPLTNPRVLGWIEKPPLAQSYFEDYYQGLSSTVLYRDVAISQLGPIRSEAIVPELADLLLRTEHVSWSLCIGQMESVLIMSLRSSSRKQQAGGILRKLVGHSGSAGGHREMAGGIIPVPGMNTEEIQDLEDKIVEKFLVLINRKKQTARKLVHSQ